MKVLMINGSPHEKGCTYTALREVAGELEKEGIEVEILHLGNKPIRGCTACHACFKPDATGCAFDDGFVNLALEKAKTADGFVFGSPVHYAAATGTITSFLHRFFYAGEGFRGKPGAAIVSCRRAGSTAALDQLNKYFCINGMPMVPSQYWNMVHGNNPDEVRQDKEGMQVMRTLGRNMAWMLKCFELGRIAGVNPPELEERQVTNFIR